MKKTIEEEKKEEIPAFFPHIREKQIKAELLYKILKRAKEADYSSSSLTSLYTVIASTSMLSGSMLTPSDAQVVIEVALGE